MGSARGERIQQLFEAALQLPADQRSDYLQRECGGDLELRREVESLLKHDAAADESFLEPLPPMAPNETRSGQPTAEAPRRRVEQQVGDPAAHSGADKLGARTSAAPSAILPQIEGYQLVREIGRGGMGIVYEAVQEKLNRTVALKFLPAISSAIHSELIQRFGREAKAAARLHHTNIIPVYDFGHVRDGYYYAMELIGGQPLSSLIKRLARFDTRELSPTTLIGVLQDTSEDSGVGLPPESEQHPSSGSGSATRGRTYYRQVAEWIASVAEALHYAHVQGVVHRDIKPSNLMVRRDGRMVILDFGLVKTAGDQSVTSTGSLVGTYRYMSPEQIGAKRIKVDARSDIYSLSATLYELLTFLPVFPTTDHSELLSQILFKEPAAPRQIVNDVPLDLQTICLKGLEKSPSARYQTAGAMADDLRRFLSDQPIVARPQGLTGRLLKFVRRNGALLTTASAVLLAVTAIAGVLDYRRRAYESWRESQNKGAADLRGRNEFPKAIEIYRTMLRRDPRDARTLVNLASTYSEQYAITCDPNLLGEADKLLKRATDLESIDHRAWNSRAAVLMNMGLMADSIDAARRAVELKNDYYPAWVNLSLAHALGQDLETALECATRGTEIVDQLFESGKEDAKLTKWYAMAPRVLGAIQWQSGRLDEAEISLEKAWTFLERRDLDALVLRAHVLLEKGGNDRVLRAYQLLVTARELAPLRPSGTAIDASDGPPGACASQTRFRVPRALALCCLRRGDWTGALAAADEALSAADPRPALAHLIKAIAFARLGDVAKAREAQRLATMAKEAPPIQFPFEASQDGETLWFDRASDLDGPLTELNALLPDQDP